MAMDADFTGLKGELLYEYYIRQEGDDVTRTVTAKEVAGWLHEVALQLGKHKLAGEANTYAKRLVEDGFGDCWAGRGRPDRSGNEKGRC